MNKKHPGVDLRGKTYWIKYSRNGRPFRESSHSDKESDAVRLLNLRRGDIARGVPVTPKIGRVLIDELVEDMKTDLLVNGRSTRNLEWRWEIHLQPFFGGRRAASITTADVKRFIVHRQQGKAMWHSSGRSCLRSTAGTPQRSKRFSGTTNTRDAKFADLSGKTF